MILSREQTNSSLNIKQNEADIIKARKYLYEICKELVVGISDDTIFRYIGYSQNGEYTRYHFCEGFDRRVIHIVISEEEREKIIELFKKKAPNKAAEYNYTGSLIGIFWRDEVKHRFSPKGSGAVIFMSDEGEM